MNAVLEIEKGVEPPGRLSRYPYSLLEVSDSFVIPDLSMQVVCNLNYRWGLKLKKKFVCRKCDEGIRVWRVK
jgi:hypothetical protein